MNKKYVVFGAGRMGRAIAWHLVEDPTTRSVVLADIDNVALSSLSREFLDAGLGHKVSTHATSSGRWNDDILDDSSLSNILSGADVCIATCGYNSYVKLTNACIKNCVHMVDLGGNRDVVDSQKSLTADASAAGVTVIPDCGLAPGMIGILGMHAFLQLQHKKCSNIDVNMRVGGLPMSPGSVDENPLQYGLTWSSDGLINEYLIPADELRNGNIVSVPALSECENIVINTPWKHSEFEAFSTGGGSSNLPFILKGKARNVNYKTLRYRGHCSIMKGIKQLGFFDGDLRKSLISALDANLQLHDGNDIVIARAGARGMLGNNTTSFVIYEIFSSKDNKRNFSAMAQTTGFSAAIVAQMIADGTIKSSGVIDGEVAVPGEQFIERLKRTGIKVKETHV